MSGGSPIKKAQYHGLLLARINRQELAVILRLGATFPAYRRFPMMLIPVAPAACPVCRSEGLVFALECHSGKDRCLCGRCGLFWIAPDPVTTAMLDAAMTSPTVPHEYCSPVTRSTNEGRRPCTSTVIGTYTYTI
jgi:hypothetical protein